MITPPSGSARKNIPPAKLKPNEKSNNSPVTLSSTTQEAQKIKGRIEREKNKEKGAFVGKKDVSSIAMFIIKDTGSFDKGIVKTFQENKVKQEAATFAHAHAASTKEGKETLVTLKKKIEGVENFNALCLLVQKENLMIEKDFLIHSTQAANKTEKGDFHNVQAIKALKNKMTKFYLSPEITLNMFLMFQNQRDQADRDTINDFLKRFGNLKAHISHALQVAPSFPIGHGFKTILDQCVKELKIDNQQDITPPMQANTFAEKTKNFFKTYCQFLESYEMPEEDKNRLWLHTFAIEKDGVLPYITPAKLKEVLLDKRYKSDQLQEDKISCYKLVLSSGNTELKEHAKEYMAEFVSQLDKEGEAEMRKFIGSLPEDQIKGGEGGQGPGQKLG